MDTNNRYEFLVRWADVDANVHLRHSAYADYAAQARVFLLEDCGLGFRKLNELKIGPILFREELIYHREVNMNDRVTVICEISKATKDASRWSVCHQMFRSDGVKAATIHVDGAWMDLKKRKLTALPSEYESKFLALKKSEYFTWIDK